MECFSKTYIWYLFFLSALILNPVYAIGSLPKKTTFIAGVTSTYQSEEQAINVQGLIGDSYTVSKRHDQNLLLGLGFFNPYNELLSYGINLFYLAKTSVKGLIVQERLFKNLSYQFDVTHLPILATIQSQKDIGNGNKAISVDIGIGPNILRVQEFRDFSRDGGVTLPNNAFLDKTQVEFAASAKLGVLCKKAIKGHPFELAYRFFYLGKGKLKPRTSLIQNALHTRDAYAHSITLSTTLEG